MFELPWDTGEKPNFISPTGVKFWILKSSTQYAEFLGLEKVQVFFTLHPDGEKTRLIVDNGKPVYEDTSLEGIGFRLDIMKYLKESEDDV